MKIRYLGKTVLLLSFFWLVACVSHTHDFVQAQVQNNLLQENWQEQIDQDPVKWKKHADNWLWFGTPNAVECANRQAPYSEAMSTMMVKVPDFTEIKMDGDFQVQIDGRFQHNSVYLYGPNEEIRQIVVEVRDHRLDIHRAAIKDPQHVIIRIAIHNLQKLIQNGSGKIQGRFIRANPLRLTSTGSGDLILTGRINVSELEQSGSGDITILGAYTPHLKIDSSGSGTLNISGRVGVASINHSGSGDINIIGADSNSLFIWAEGLGKIGIKGLVNLKQVTASGNVGVYVDQVKSQDIYAYLRDKAMIGLSGQTKTLYIDARGSSIFAGSKLLSRYTYARAREWAHINTTADDRAFAAADDNSSIYIFGWPNVISPYVNDNAVIIPLDPPPRTPIQELRYRKKQAKRFGSETYLP
ncbi:MAG TPA: DUF2807 domain-containing protein [Gammaproteobacteria bacterium]|nr:DUF2807 domain-containing protein [Gammaproteobacteria bacterium]